MSGLGSYSEFEVYKKSYQLSLEVHRYSLHLPVIEQRALADQIRRSSKSICANFAEGFVKQKYSNNEFRRYLIVSLGSSSETVVWLEYCRDLGYLGEIESQRLISGYNEVSRMLQGLIKKVVKKS